MIKYLLFPNDLFKNFDLVNKLDKMYLSDRFIKQQKQVDKIFLMYNRAWSGTREYRLRFVDLLINSDLQEYCRTSFNPIDLFTSVQEVKTEKIGKNGRPLLRNRL